MSNTPLAVEIAEKIERRKKLERTSTPLPENTRILTVSNQKGGVGKTTTAVNLAAAFARRGARVLVIDLDPQGNTSTAMGVMRREDTESIYEVLLGECTISEAIQQSTDHENLFCVPATIHLAGAEIELVAVAERETLLRQALFEFLEASDKPYHYVIIDCPPSLGMLTINAFVAATEVLIPIQCEYYALEGLSQLISNIELIRNHLNPNLVLSTLLLTMYAGRTNLSAEVAKEVRDHFPEQTLSTVIPRSVRISEAPSFGQTVLAYDSLNVGALAYFEAAHEMAERFEAATNAATSRDEVIDSGEES
ncbi:ParA family protein [Canibacter sp. lx-45]|uniref:ParA family protein n=1 Tax=Canibacter zhuwentaonis TaxID=2837491 RepID=UPI001BDD2104|nr:ParA family protein [Canibacter zhuwentaonis]